MNSLRILVLSNTRPSRAWRFARRIAQEVPGAEICGIVQRPVLELPLEQQWLAKAKVELDPANCDLYARLRCRLQSAFESVGNAILWFVHGCPRKLNASPKFSIESLADRCAEHDWPLLPAKTLHDRTVSDFIASARPDLIVALGEVPSLPEVATAPFYGWIRARMNDILSSAGNGAQGLRMRIEHLTKISGPVQDLACVTLPHQVHDSRLGFTLKADLVADDMLTHAIVGMHAGGTWQAANEVTRWIDEILSPYLKHLGPSRAAAPSLARLWYRSVWSLTVETLLLCSPMIVARNWLRRIRGRYPVLILVHHLVSDRTHRMSISTEAFWHQVLFLRRHYRVVSLTEASDILTSGRAPFPAVSLTFDDGYGDNFVSLRAVAEELGVSVALFIATQPVELHREFHHDVSKGLHGAFPMTWSQIRYWKQRGAEFGTHTRTHIKCGVADRATLQEEIVGCKADYEHQLGETPRFFAFPYGNRQDLPAEAVEIAASAYPYFLSAFGGENSVCVDKPQSHLYRKNAYPEPWELELELQSVFDFVDSAKRTVRLSHRGFSTPAAEKTIATSELPALKPALTFDNTAGHLLGEPHQAAIQRPIKLS